MAQAKGNFSTINSTEREPFGFDFVNDLPSGDSIVSAQAFLVAVSGTDPAAQSHCVGSPVINGTVVSQRLSGLTAGVIYRFTILISSYRDNVFDLWQFVKCVPPP